MYVQAAYCIHVLYMYIHVHVHARVYNFMYMWQSQVESEHYSNRILTAFSDSALYNSKLQEAMALQFVVEIVLPF